MKKGGPNSKKKKLCQKLDKAKHGLILRPKISHFGKAFTERKIEEEKREREKRRIEEEEEEKKGRREVQGEVKLCFGSIMVQF